MSTITEQDIANYLRSTPEFFERQADLLADVRLVSPHSRRAVSLQERQAEMLREKIRLLEGRLIEMIRHGSDNLALSDRMLRWARDLLLVQEAAAVPEAIASSIQLQFAVPQVAIRVWDLAPAYAGAAFAQGVSEDARLFASSLHEPFCGVNSGFEATAWLEHPTQAVSLALLPLRPLDAGNEGPAFGMVVLASPDSQRYTSTMGTEFLARIAEVASAALSTLR
jgi:uncharacterized protein YigA (DUF484 family)